MGAGGGDCVFDRAARDGTLRKGIWPSGAIEIMGSTVGFLCSGNGPLASCWGRGRPPRRGAAEFGSMRCGILSGLPFRKPVNTRGRQAHLPGDQCAVDDLVESRKVVLNLSNLTFLVN
mmetsp:Transcript_36696/g.96843  ORF Transcript_36696/g.96843 Transcript_36696/m.96843 type:complete len:118 (-) Transcript_36696:8539-8892(-)